METHRYGGAFFYPIWKWLYGIVTAASVDSPGKEGYTVSILIFEVNRMKKEMNFRPLVELAAMPVAQIVLGLILLVNPDGAISAVCRILGWMMVAVGLFFVGIYITDKKNRDFGTILMVLGFGIHLAVDYCRYKESFTSAPFWIWAVVDGLVWLLPALLAFLAGYISKKKLCKKENSK